MSVNGFKSKVRSNTDEERVEVNQRLLIDKILARYSSEFVIYRELMQNADDANSSNIQIIFEIEKNKIKQFRFKNDGFPFRPQDWKRLKNIAEGNPDEQKIGAFGVGFYSLFSVCEEPFVSSGGKGMYFYWRGNQLFTKQGNRKPIDGWTTFLFEMREPIELPDVQEFTRFLTNSLTFTMNLREISVYFDDTLVIELSKKMQEPNFMDIPPGFNKFSPQKMFHLTSVDFRDVKIDVKNQAVKPTSIFFRIASGNVDVKASNAFSAEMERITKKKPPSKTTIQVICTGFEEYNSSGDRNNISKELLPYPDQGKIYIGFPTHQTTGCCIHLSARVIPTVERESIDLVDKTLAKYNSELLSLAGTMCRILYEDEMAYITQLCNEMDTSDEEENTKSSRELIENRAAHVLTHFTFEQSTPITQVGNLLESQFFDCSKEKLPILSTNGIRSISEVRILNPKMSGFIKTVPVVPKIIFEQCNTFFEKAKNTTNIIKDLSFKDVLCELKGRILSVDEIIDLLKWWISYRSEGNAVDLSKVAQFLQLARFGDDLRSLSTIRYFLNPGTIPPNINLSDEVLPFVISKDFKDKDLEKWLEWSELSVGTWAKFISNKPDLEIDPAFAEKVHHVLARNLEAIPKDDKNRIHNLFGRKKCIPTKHGMEVPNDAYFEKVNLFPNLPTIEFRNLSPNIKHLMKHLGVRKAVEINHIIDRLINKENCDYKQLVKYLASAYDNLKKGERKILRRRPIWPQENLTDSEQIKHSILSDLYIPLTSYRELGLPVIDWEGTWYRDTPEGKFLIQLGLKENLPLKKVLGLAASSTDSEIRDKALKYLIDNFEKYSNFYQSGEKVEIEFLPCSDPDIYAKPSECFINPECMIMNFKVINQDFQSQVGKLGVCQNPDRKKLLERLTQDPPQDEDNAKKIFEYLASQQAVFTDSDWNTFADSKFIPIKKNNNNRRTKHSNKIIYTSPCSCYFKVQEELKDSFLCIDFGEKANKFLQRCGVKDEPSSIELTELLLKSSRKLWKSISLELYLDILRRIAINFNTSEFINLISEMSNAHILVAVMKRHNSDNEEKDDGFYLTSAKEIFINDDKVYQEVFNPLMAPEEDLLETLYKELGCRSLHKSVKETSTQKGTTRETEKSRQLQNIIAERASLFYHKQPKHKIEKDDEWLKKLKVREIDYIETTYVLDTTITIKVNNTSILQDEREDSWILYMTSKSDFLDISKNIVKKIYNPHEWNDIFSFNILLITPLPNLKEMGYPVDNISQLPNLQDIFDDQVKIKQENENLISPIENSSFSSIFSQSQLRPRSQPKPQPQSHPQPQYQPQSQFHIGTSNQSFMNRKPVVINTYSWKPVVITNEESTNKKPDTITSETTQVLRNFLQDAIKACYSDSESIVNNRNNIKNNTKACNFCNFNLGSIINQEARIRIVEGSQTNYCTIITDDLLYCVETLQEIELHIPMDLKKSEILSQAHIAPLNRFINMLKDLAEVFELKPKDIHIFYDKNASSIAFNREKALFFNFKFYLELHEEECKIKSTTSAITYWFMMFCHELAHNFISHHNSEHEKFTCQIY